MLVPTTNPQLACLFLTIWPTFNYPDSILLILLFAEHYLSFALHYLPFALTVLRTVSAHYTTVVATLLQLLRHYVPTSLSSLRSSLLPVLRGYATTYCMTRSTRRLRLRVLLDTSLRVLRTLRSTVLLFVSVDCYAVSTDSPKSAKHSSPEVSRGDVA